MTSKLNNRNRLKIQSEALSNRSSLTAVVMALNGENPLLHKSEEREALVRYVEAWNTAKRNPWKMRLTRDDAKRFSLSDLEKVWTWKLVPIGRTAETDRKVAELEARGVQVREDVGGAYWALSPTGTNCRDVAAMFVGMLLTNPLRGKLSDGPCQRKACGKWFMKKRPSQKQCSRRCLAVVRSMAAVKKEREKAHKDNLRKARKAWRNWRRKSGMDRKTYVSLTTGLTKKFLTRNEGLIAPKVQKTRRRKHGKR